jgi:hypothetical protein
MKHLLLLLFCISVIFTKAQTWSPSGAEWVYNYYSMVATGYQKITYEKDTVVLSNACSKLVGELVFRYTPWSGVPSTTINTVPIAPIYTYLQNDTAYTLYNNIFRPVYYFNANVGDTLSYYNYILPKNQHTICDTIIKQVVDSSGTVIINNDTLRFYRAHHINISSSFLYLDQVTVVERFGAVNSYFVPYFICYTDGDEYSLCSYSDNQFTNPSQVECDKQFTSINDMEEIEVSIYPNPATESININLANANAYTSVQLLDYTGRIVAEQAINSGLVSIARAQHSAGMYFVRLVKNDNTMAIKKVIFE